MLTGTPAEYSQLPYALSYQYIAPRNSNSSYAEMHILCKHLRMVSRFRDCFPALPMRRGGCGLLWYVGTNRERGLELLRWGGWPPNGPHR